MLFTLAWRNLWRNKSRTFITMASVFFAVLLSVFTISLQKGVWDNLTKNVVSFYTGYAQIHLKGYWDEQILDNSFADNDTLNKLILNQQHIKAATPRLESFALASSYEATKGSIVVGIDPDNEDFVTKLKNKIIRGKYLTLQDSAVLITEGLAKKLKIDTGDTIVLLGQGYHGSTAAGKYPIIGILKFASPELNEGMIYMPLNAAQNLYGASDMLTSLVLSLDDPANLEKVVKALIPLAGVKYEVMTWAEMMPEIKELIRTKEGSTYIIIGMLYLLVSFGIFGTLLMMAAERTYEFGMLMAIGMKRLRLASVVLIESLLVTITGCITGIMVSIPLVYYLSVNPLRFTGQMAEMYEGYGFEPVIPTIFSPSLMLEQTIIISCIAFLLSLYPIMKVFTLNEVEAMKK